MAILTKYFLWNNIHTSGSLFIKNSRWIKLFLVETSPTALSAVSCSSTATAESATDAWKDTFNDWKRGVRLDLLKDDERVIHLTHLKAIQVRRGVYYN